MSISQNEVRNDCVNWTSQSPNSTAIAEHKSGCDGEPSVYVGTYGKYNGGEDPLRSLWIDLSSFDDYDEFINFCKAIHADEYDPELMAQDFKDFPRDFYNEGVLLRMRQVDNISRDDFDNILQYSEMCESSAKTLWTAENRQ